MRNVRRYDAGKLSKPTETREGWLRVDAHIARVGLLEYPRADGTVQVEYRPPEEAFHPDALASFDLVPITNDHPPAGFIDDQTTKLYQVGTVASARQDGEKVAAHMLITDERAVADVKSGKVQVSGGYTCDLDFTPGEFEGRKYDAIQRNVRGNHVAIVWAGRAGPDIRLRMDSMSAEVVQPDCTGIGQPKEQPKMLKIKIDGVECEVSEIAAQLLAKTDAQRVAVDLKAKSDLDSANARADAAESAAKKLKTELDAAPAKAREDAKARLELETAARGVLGEAAKFDGKSDTEIKREVAASVLDLKLDGKSDSYVAASFDLAVKQHADGKGSEQSTLERSRAGTAEVTAHADADPIATASRTFHERTRTAQRE